MKATAAQLIRLLQTRAQFVIPIYQRTYSWTTAQCQRLWDDIIAAGEQPGGVGHFIGSVVYLDDPGPKTSFNKLLVIDGQQRLTTITLLLIAMRNRIEVTGASSRSALLRSLAITSPIPTRKDQTATSSC